MKGLLGMAKQKKEESSFKNNNIQKQQSYSKQPPQHMGYPKQQQPYGYQQQSDEEGEVMEEEIDEDYEPTQQYLQHKQQLLTSAEIIEYAYFLGIDPIKEKDLLYIAKEGLVAPLPPQWKPIQAKNQEIYYLNIETGEKVWEHPCDQYYQQLVIKERARLEQKKIAAQKQQPMQTQSKVGLQNYSTSNLSRKEDSSPAKIPEIGKPLGKVKDDPLLRIEEEKKKKKLEEDKKKQFQKRRDEIEKKYDERKEQITKANFEKQESQRKTYKSQQQAYETSSSKKASEAQREVQNKFNNDVQEFRTQLQKSLEAAFQQRLQAEKDSIESTYRSKKEEVRRNLEAQSKKQKKAIQEQHERQMRQLQSRQKELRKSAQPKENDFEAQLEKLRKQHIAQKLQENKHIIEAEKLQQERILAEEIQKLQEQHNKRLSNLEAEKPAENASSALSMDAFMAELDKNYKAELKNIEYELEGVRQLRKFQTEEKLVAFQMQLEEFYRNKLREIEEKYGKQFDREKERILKEYEFNMSQIQKKAHADFIKKIDSAQFNHTEEENTVLASMEIQKMQRNSEEVSVQETLGKLNSELARLDEEWVKLKKLVVKLELECQNSKSHLQREEDEKGPVYGRLSAYQKDLYDVLQQKWRGAIIERP